MFNIKRFTLQSTQAKLSIAFTQNTQKTSILDYEYIRVFSPLDGFAYLNNDNIEKKQTSKHQPTNNKNIIAHKQQIQLTNIESVAQHGYRLIFDDQHSAIYSVEYLLMLCEKQNELWQQYLTALKKSGHTREATISITQL